MEWVHQFRSWFARHRQKIGLIVVGHTAKKVEEITKKINEQQSAYSILKESTEPAEKGKALRTVEKNIGSEVGPSGRKIRNSEEARRYNECKKNQELFNKFIITPW